MDLPYSLIDLPTHSWKSYRYRRPFDICKLVIHHVAHPTWGPNEIANFHVMEKGWPGIAYHFFIYDNGTVVQTNGIGVKSYHVGEYNKWSIGICLQGDFTHFAPGNLQIKATDKLIDKLLVLFPDAEVCHHRDLRNTDCPGLAVPDWLFKR